MIETQEKEGENCDEVKHALHLKTVQISEHVINKDKVGHSMLKVVEPMVTTFGSIWTSMGYCNCQTLEYTGISMLLEFKIDLVPSRLTSQG